MDYNFPIVKHLFNNISIYSSSKLINCNQFIDITVVIAF